MLLLKTTNDLLRVVTDAAGDVEVYVAWMKHDSGTFTPDRDNIASITSATTTTILTGPASGIYNVKHLNIRNNHASQAVLVTVFHTDGTDQEDLFECVLLAGEALVFTQGGIWVHYGVSGAPYACLTAAATQADMEAASSETAAVRVDRQHFHPGHPKAWGKATVSGGTPTLQVSYNTTSITDTAQGRLTWTIATDFSSADWACNVTVERAATALTNANLRYPNVESGGQAAGSVILECGTASPNATDETLEDPTSWHFLGLGDQA